MPLARPLPARIGLEFSQSVLWLLVGALFVLLQTALPAFAAGYESIGVESVFTTAPRIRDLNPYAIVIASNRRRLNQLPAGNRQSLQQFFVYQTRVRVQQQEFFRLVVGNYSNANTARIALQRLAEIYPDAWIYRRNADEMKQLARFIQQSAPRAVSDSAAEVIDAPVATAATAKAEKLLEMARQDFIDGDYARVIAITDRVTLTGNVAQVRESLELAGITRERLGQFAQAVVLYRALLDTQPPPEVATRVRARLDGIVTMSQAPKSPMEPSEKKPESEWNFRGFVQQFYQDDRLDLPEESSEAINQALISDVDLYLQRRSDTYSLVFNLDAGLVDDYLEDVRDTRISKASVEYARDSFRIIGGRQSRTMTGVYGRFDGLVYKDISQRDYRFSYAYGYLVESSFDNLETERPFIGANMTFSPGLFVDVDLYLFHQELYGLTDRQAVGTEIRFQNDNSYAFGTIDYDVFYEKFNNLSLFSNYRFSDRWSLNFNLAEGYSPILSTINAQQGQPVENLEELRALFTDDEIYQLAEDRTSKSAYVYIGSSYRFDSNRQLYIDISSLELDATVSSGGVEAVPASEDLELSVDYSFQGLLFDDDYASIGIRLTDSTNSETTSLRARTRFTGYGQISYDPRLQLDLRTDKNSGDDQLIVKPSIKLKYRVTRNLNFEGTLSIEYSETDLPQFDEQYIYSSYFGYYYLF